MVMHLLQEISKTNSEGANHLSQVQFPEYMSKKNEEYIVHLFCHILVFAFASSSPAECSSGIVWGFTLLSHVIPGITGKLDGGVWDNGELRRFIRNFLSYMIRVPIGNQ